MIRWSVGSDMRYAQKPRGPFVGGGRSCSLTTRNPLLARRTYRYEVRKLQGSAVERGAVLLIRHLRGRSAVVRETTR